MKRLFAALAVFATALAGIGIAVTPAAAAEPTMATIRLVSPVITSSNAWDGAKDAAEWVTKDYYKDGLRYYRYPVESGSSTSLTYLATDQDGKPIANHAIKLAVNKQWSLSNAKMQVGDKTTIADPGMIIDGMTNGEGKVTFVLKNNNLGSEGDAIPTDRSKMPANSLYSQVAPKMFETETKQIIDIVDLSYYKKAGAIDTSRNIRLIPEQKDLTLDTWDASAWYNIAGSPAYLKWFTAGATSSLTYVVTEANGTTPVPAGTTVWLNINQTPAEKRSNWLKADGSALDAAKTAGHEGGVSGVTDAAGKVTFTLKNTNTQLEAENVRTVKNAWSCPTRGCAWNSDITNELATGFYPTLGGAVLEKYDRVWGHLVQMGAPEVSAAKVTDTATIDAPKTVSFTIKNAIGEVVPGAVVQFSTNSKGTLAATSGVADAAGKVSVDASATAAGIQNVVVAYVDGRGIAGTAITAITWSEPKPVVSVSVAKRVISVKATLAKGKKVTVTVNGKSVLVKTPTSFSATAYKYTAPKAGKYTVKITVVGGTTVTKVYTIK
jgi:hypothetical protein